MFLYLISTASFHNIQVYQGLLGALLFFIISVLWAIKIYIFSLSFIVESEQLNIFGIRFCMEFGFLDFGLVKCKFNFSLQNHRTGFWSSFLDLEKESTEKVEDFFENEN